MRFPYPGSPIVENASSRERVSQNIVEQGWRFRLKNLPRPVKVALMVITDLSLVPFALWLAWVLKQGSLTAGTAPPLGAFLLAPLLSIPIFHYMGVYRTVVRYVDYESIWATVRAVSLAVPATAGVLMLMGNDGLLQAVLIIYWFTLNALIAGSRMLARAWLFDFKERGQRRGVVIYGAGSDGVRLASKMRKDMEFKPVAFVDDDRTLWGSLIAGLRVYAPKELADLVRIKRVAEVFLALPSASPGRRREILDALEKLPLYIRILPSSGERKNRVTGVEALRDIELEDLLGREPVVPEKGLLRACIQDKAVMVTGAGGSIGSELCRQIVALGPRRLVLLEISEFALYTVDRELRSIAARQRHRVEIVPVLGSTQDRARCEKTLRELGVNTVYHAAAYKHVPLVEHNAIEGIRNNVLGTWRLAESALATGVETFVLISTDKAVRPSNIMGASKRCSELILLRYAKEGRMRASGRRTRFSIVRFGNVLGSSGSVVPVFREQIKAGGPVTVTHQDVTRYFMTVTEAAQLVLQAGSMGKGGEIFVLDMGEPIRIVELARKMIRLMGREVRDSENLSGEITIEYTGLRPGEKLYEELLIGDNATGTQHPRIWLAEKATGELPPTMENLDALADACERGDCAVARRLLASIVVEYGHPAESDDPLCTSEPPRKEAGGEVIALARS